MNIEFGLYEGFLITDDQEGNVKAYRNREYYAGNTTSYEASSPADIRLMIDEAGDHGDFTEAEYYILMRQLGRAEEAEPTSATLDTPESYYMVSPSGFDTAAVLAVFWSKLKYTSPTELELSLQDILSEVDMTAERKQQVSVILRQMVTSGLLDEYQR